MWRRHDRSVKLDGHQGDRDAGFQPESEAQRLKSLQDFPPSPPAPIIDARMTMASDIITSWLRPRRYRSAPWR